MGLDFEIRAVMAVRRSASAYAPDVLPCPRAQAVRFAGSSSFQLVQAANDTYVAGSAPGTIAGRATGKTTVRCRDIVGESENAVQKTRRIQALGVRPRRNSTNEGCSGRQASRHR
jgi:hypothetical protein